jgi:hypothetical protein
MAHALAGVAYVLGRAQEWHAPELPIVASAYEAWRVPPLVLTKLL